jgi:hypothetical protein
MEWKGANDQLRAEGECVKNLNARSFVEKLCRDLCRKPSKNENFNSTKFPPKALREVFTQSAQAALRKAQPT